MDEIEALSADLLVEQTVDQEDEGPLLGADELKDSIQQIIISGDEEDYPGAAEDKKLGQAFKHHTYYEFRIIGVRHL